MLLQIREFLRREKIASNQQIARTFNVDLYALEPMLEVWLRKGVFAYAQDEAQISCGKRSFCGGCQGRTIVYYRYIGL